MVPRSNQNLSGFVPQSGDAVLQAFGSVYYIRAQTQIENVALRKASSIYFHRRVARRSFTTSTPVKVVRGMVVS